MARLAANGSTFDYEERGSGAPIVLIHGTLEDRRSWTQQLEPFSKSFRTIAYSRRYHFPNAVRGDETNYSPTLHARDLEAVLGALAIERAHLIGASYGAYIALNLAVHHPECVTSLVLGEPPIVPWLRKNPETAPLADAFYKNAWQPVAEAFQRGETEAAVEAFVDGVSGKGAFARTSPRTRAILMQNAPALRVEVQSPEYFQPLGDDLVQQLTIPVLLLGGQQSPVHFGKILDRLETLLPHPTRVWIPNAGHALNLWNAPFYNETVLNFLRGVR